MRKSAFLLFVCLIATLISCTKKETTPYDASITGVQLRQLDASPTGVVGALDTKSKTDNFTMSVYPTPSVTQLNITVTIKNSSPLTLKAKLVNVLFPGAPKGTTIENSKMAGTVASTLSENIAAAPVDTANNSGTTGGVGELKDQVVHFAFDVSKLPKGFYRVYIETSAGDQYWDNGWITN